MEINSLPHYEMLDKELTLGIPDAMLLDMHLPKRDGEQILRSIRGTYRSAQMPVIVMTSSTAPWDRQAAEKHSALHCFTKPSSLTKFMRLGAVVRNLLTESGLLRAAVSGGSAT